MKISVVTTFNEQGYNKYAQRMIRTFLENWPKEVMLYVYAEDCCVLETAENLTVLDLNDSSPELVKFKKTWKDVPKANGKEELPPIVENKKEQRGLGFKWNAVRFSHKVYAVFHCAKKFESDILIWMDADSVCHSPISLMQIQLFCPLSVDIAFLGRQSLYTECGLYYLNLTSKRTRDFLSEYQKMYDNAENGIFTLDEWHDCEAFDHVRKNMPSLVELDWARDLDVNELHPLVNCFWGQFIDHLKGNRKSVGQSHEGHKLGAQKVHYWDSRPITIFIPRLDLPWKPLKSGVKYPVITEDLIDIRLYWKELVVRLANLFEISGFPVKIEEIPAWEITRERVEASKTLFAFVPHHCHIDFDEGETPVMFYMQEYFRSVFTCDTKGWSAASSVYPVNLETLPESSRIAFDVYRNRLLAGELGSKFGQIPRKDFSELASSGTVPSTRSFLGLGAFQRVPYIFFPLQIPHDQSIQYFSDVEEIEVVKSLVDWARENNVAVVLKPHPANLKVMKQFEVFVDNLTVFWSTANVYDLIEYSTAVYTINSGVGFESLLHLKPVVTFGRAEYDCVTFHLENNNFHDAWKYCLEVESKTLENKYSKFINWFLGEYAIDLSQPQLATITLERVVNQVISYVKQSEK